MKTTYSLLLNLILALTFRTAQAGDNNSAVREGRLSLDEVTNVVRAKKPASKAAQEKWRAMKARVPQAAAWEDLRAQARSRAARYVSIPPNAFTDQSFMLQQEVPISGKNLSRARAATAEAGAAFEDFRRTELDVLSRARAAFHRLANEYAQLEVNQRNVDLLNQFAEVNRQRYEVGNASQADVLTAQTDAAKLLEAQSDIFRRISDAQSQLNVLMDRPAQAPLAQPSQIPFQPPRFSLQALQAVALSARPEMQRAQNVLEAERTGTLGLVRDERKRIVAAAHHYELCRENISPLARQAVQSNRVAYEARGANFLELLTAQRVLRGVESAHVDHLADYHVTL